MAGFKDINWQELQENIASFDPNDIDWENAGSWSVIGKAVSLALCFLAILIAGYVLFISDKSAALSSAENREQTLKQDFERKAFRGANLNEYKSQMLEMEDAFGSLLKQLPRDTEVPGLVDDISSAALGSGLTLSAIDPGSIQKTEFYNELPIDIAVEGGYHEMGGFVSAVASLPRIVTLHDFSIEKTNKPGVLKMNIRAKTYQYSSDEDE